MKPLINVNIDSADRSQMFYWQMDRPFDEKETEKIFLKRHSNFNPRIAKIAITEGMIKYGLSQNDAQVVQLTNPINSGSVNNVVIARLQNGMTVVLRQHPDNIFNGYFRVEKAITDLVSVKGIPTYETYYIDDSMEVFPFAFMITSYVEGEIVRDFLTKEPSYDLSLTEQAGSLAAHIHSIPTKGFGFFSNSKVKFKKKLIGIHSVWKGHFYAALDDNLKYLRETSTITEDEEMTIREIFKFYRDIIYCENPVLVHNDIADWNLIVKDGKISGVMDWDECISGDPVMEFAAYNLFYTGEKYDAFLKGYQKVRPIPEDYKYKINLYKLRYVVSKAVGRRKKLSQENENMRNLLDLALRTMHELFEILKV